MTRVQMRNNQAGFTKRLNELIAKRALSQSELARLTGIASSQISRYCRGEAFPFMRQGNSLARALNVAPAYLLEGVQAEDDQLLIEGLAELERREQASDARIIAELQQRLAELEKKLEASLVPTCETCGAEAKIRYIDGAFYCEECFKEELTRLTLHDLGVLMEKYVEVL